MRTFAEYVQGWPYKSYEGLDLRASHCSQGTSYAVREQTHGLRNPGRPVAIIVETLKVDTGQPLLLNSLPVRRIVKTE